MCGIAGFVSASADRATRETVVWSMIGSIRHRGPDAQAVISAGAATLGVARLSIVDRPLGHQPMSFAGPGGARWIAYNGEVYNFAALRDDLAARGAAFRTRSDTEAVLAAVAHDGEDAVGKLDGMFGFAVWNPDDGALLLARDRLGIKPLFYADWGDELAFASEPKALLRHPRARREPNPLAVLEYFTHGCAFASGYSTHDQSFFAGVKALPPGHVLAWSPGKPARLSRYWSPADELGRAPAAADPVGELADAVRDSVRATLLGEVPVGTALSGGLDSSYITSEAAAATAAADRPLVSATITFRADGGDADAAHAGLVSRWLNAREPGCHRLEYTHLRPESYLDRLDDMIRAFDEPHWELRQLGMFANYATLARAGRTVVLTGEGADELFFGYYQKFPGFRSPPLSGPDEFLAAWRTRVGWARGLLAPAFASGAVGESDLDGLMRGAVGRYLTPTWEASGSRLRAVQAWYLHTFLHWLLLVNDRCSMWHGLEGRFPFLTNRLIRLGLNLPPEQQVGPDGPMREKVLLRRGAARALPPEVWRDRDKAPLPVPDATAYHRAIWARLKDEVGTAGSGVWQFVSREFAQNLLDEYERAVASAGAEAGLELTRYIPLGEPLRVRTAQLFGLLTLLRWFAVCT